VPQAAVAHPHVFIDNRVTFLFAGDKITGFRENWVFDEVFSDQLLQHFDQDQNGSLSAAESEAVAAETLPNLAHFRYFTYVWVDGKDLGQLDPRDFHASAKKGLVTFDFRIDLPRPVDPLKQELAVEINDRDYYVEVLLAKAQPIAFKGLDHLACEPSVTTDVDHARMPMTHAWRLQLLALLLPLMLLLVRPQAEAQRNPILGGGEGGEAQPAAAGSGPLHRLTGFIIAIQRNVNREINRRLVAIRDGRGLGVVLAGIVIAFLYGVFHALGPGHGKAVIMGYFLGCGGGLTRGAAMAGWIALSHVAGAVVVIAISTEARQAKGAVSCTRRTYANATATSGR
jgi:ABC-type uncharacterized transport system substrate-binding protein